MWVRVPDPYVRCLSLFCCSAMPFHSVAIGVGNDAGKIIRVTRKMLFGIWCRYPLNLWAVFARTQVQISHRQRDETANHTHRTTKEFRCHYEQRRIRWPLCHVLRFKIAENFQPKKRF